MAGSPCPLVADSSKGYQSPACWFGGSGRRDTDSRSPFLLPLHYPFVILPPLLRQDQFWLQPSMKNFPIHTTFGCRSGRLVWKLVTRDPSRLISVLKEWPFPRLWFCRGPRQEINRQFEYLSQEFEGNVPSQILDTQFNGGAEMLWHLLPHSKYGKYRLWKESRESPQIDWRQDEGNICHLFKLHP